MTAGPGRAESAIGAGRTTSGRLMFKIVIPSVLIVDTRTGTVFSNDTKAVPMIGMVSSVHVDGQEGGRIIQRDGVANAKGLHRVPLGKGTQRIARDLAQNAVLCLP
jgi:hypothetical protein